MSITQEEFNCFIERLNVLIDKINSMKHIWKQRPNVYLYLSRDHRYCKIQRINRSKASKSYKPKIRKSKYFLGYRGYMLHLTTDEATVLKHLINITSKKPKNIESVKLIATTGYYDHASKRWLSSLDGLVIVYKYSYINRIGIKYSITSYKIYWNIRKQLLKLLDTIYIDMRIKYIDYLMQTYRNAIKQLETVMSRICIVDKSLLRLTVDTRQLQSDIYVVEGKEFKGYKLPLDEDTLNTLQNVLELYEKQVVADVEVIASIIDNYEESPFAVFIRTHEDAMRLPRFRLLLLFRVMYKDDGKKKKSDRYWHDIFILRENLGWALIDLYNQKQELESIKQKHAKQ